MDESGHTAPRARRRRFTVDDKLRILAEADACTEWGATEECCAAKACTRPRYPHGGPSGTRVCGPPSARTPQRRGAKTWSASDPAFGKRAGAFAASWRRPAPPWRHKAERWGRWCARPAGSGQRKPPPF